ncbi:MAG: glutamine synthetase family protein [Candidatus Thermoplasmatota archaeon]|jgi:glutamine synthetase|nr:glutamine synthetase family protein [Candidatus Thermoplasmatota archaeon]
MNLQQIKKQVETKKVRWIQLHFTDLMGGLRVVHIPADRFLKDDIIKKGLRFDGSSVGFRKVEKSDMLAIPDQDTFMLLPHEEGEALIRADLYDIELNPYRAGPRHILKRALETAKTQGYDKVMISPEMEFYAFNDHPDKYTQIKENEGYFIPPPLDNAKNYRKKLADILMACGYQVKYHHHETGKSQHEVEVKAMDAIRAADFCCYFKYLARDIASMFNIEITFMPKPFSQEAGNGMHAHIALYKKGKNMFADENDPMGLSQTARYFIGGILEHSRAIAALANPTLNSYKRLIPHFEAPIYIAWAPHNRSSLIRIAAKKNVDIEIRNADPAANPYLFFAALIHAGLDGVKKKISYEPVLGNIYKMTDEEIKKHKIKRLPTNLMEALEEFKKDTVLMEAIGRDGAELFIQNKTNEWHEYMVEITDLDYKFYFHC